LSIALSDDGKSIEIIELVIDENYRNQGLGSEVLQRLKTFADTNNLNIKTTTISDDLTELAERKGVEVENKKSSLSDDVKEVNNDFVYNKFNEKQRTADNVILKELDDGTLELLVIKRKRGPHRSLFALPGGIVETDVDMDQIIQGIVDPGKPTFKETEVHDFLMPFQTQSTVLDISDKYRANEIFGAEALREAVEEVSLRQRFIDKSFYLPIKFDRYDWDARAAKGVDVGGIGIIIKDVTERNIVDGQSVESVVETWTPKAQDDAVSYEWIKLDDVISGEKQLAFGHVEFVEDALRFALKKNLLQKSNQETIYTNESKYDYNDIAQLKERVAETKRRNAEIILESNKVRVANGQPEIPISGNNIVDRQNKALIDSIRGLTAYSPYLSDGKTIKPFTAQIQMSPDFIFHDIIQYTTQKAGTGLIFSDKEIASVVEDAPMFADDPEMIYERITLKPEAKNKAKIQLRDKILKKYASELKSKINDGMQIGPFIAAMYDNAVQIVNSQEFNILLDELIDEGFKSHKEDEVGTTEVIETYYTDEFVDSEVKEYAGLHEGNTVIQRDGIEKAVDDNINYLINNDFDSGPALATLREKNTKFFKNTFPDEMYLSSWEYWKDKNTDVPQALLDSKQATLGADGRLKGFVYHGSPGLNKRGRAILDILEKHYPEAGQDMRKSFSDLNNKANFETDLNWLDPRVYRGQMLELNYMYTTSSPFVASSYSIGGLNPGTITARNIDAHNKFMSILNSEDIKNNSELIAKIDKDLKKIGLYIRQSDNIEKTLSIDVIKGSENKTLLVNPAITQIEFDAPGDSILHTNMPLVRQLDNPKVKNLVNNVIKNSNIESMFSKEMTDQLLYNILDQLKKSGTSLTDNMSYEEQSKIYNIINASLKSNDPDNPFIKTIKNFYIDNMQDVPDRVSREIQKGLEEGTISFSNFKHIMRDNLNGNESISNEALNTAWQYAKDSSGYEGSIQNYFFEKRMTAGEILFNKLLNDEYPTLKSGQRIDFEQMLQFANILDPEKLGGSYQATKDVLYIKYFFENMDIGSPMYNDAINYLTKKMYSDAININNLNFIGEDDAYLSTAVVHLKQYFKEQQMRIKSKYGEDVSDLINPNLEDEIIAIQNKLLPKIEGDQTLVNFLRKLNGINNRYISPVGNSLSFLLQLDLRL
jgi:8-oxo-dGTP pyrophosphatase MutT (NUDIX family)